MAKVVNFTIDQGSRWQAVIQPQVDWLSSLTGYSARGQVRTSRTLTGAVLLLDFSAYMTVDVPSGYVLIDIPADVTAALDWTTGAYDMELFDGNPAHDVRFLQGVMMLDWETTK